MNDMTQEQGETNKSPVTDVVSEPTEPTAGPSAEFQALIKSLGPDGAKRFVNAGNLMSEMGVLMSKGGTAMKENAVGELEDFNRRAKVLSAHAEVSGFDWLTEFVRGCQILIASYLRISRGNLAVSVFRHQRAKQEFQAAITGMSDSLRLMEGALDKFPQVPEFAEGKVLFQQAMYVNRQLIPFIAALEKNCDVDTLLLQGRVMEYLGGVRAIAAELRRLSDGMLGARSDDAELLALSARFSTLADTIEERAEAIEEIERSRDIYLPPGGDKIFIIHGHAEDKWRELRDLLEDKLGLKDRVIVLKEEVSRSETVIQKFEKYAKRCCYGVALITPDDEVKKTDAEYRQARPNVIFETGWFFGRFGANRLCILKRVGTEIPSDLGGVVTLEFNKDVGEKFLEIKEELQAAGIVTK